MGVLAGALGGGVALPAASDATFAGKPGRIAYSAQLPGEDESTGPPGETRDHGFDIFSVNPDGSERLRLTGNGPEPDDDQDPAWSPDGSLIVFNSAEPFMPATPYPAVPLVTAFVIGADGGGRRAIPNSSGYSGGQGWGLSGPVFFPTGDRIYLQHSDVDGLGRRSSSVGLDGSGRREEPLDALANYGPHISPDGRRKVYARYTDCCGLTWDLFISRLDGSAERRLTFTGGYKRDPVFAPDASAIAYTSNSVHVLDLRTETDTVVSDPAIGGFTPDWGAIPVKCGGKRATLVGTAGKDKMKGTNANDVIAGLGGKDKIKGKGGKDRICGGKGRDKLNGGKGKKDRCIGGKGDDDARACEREKGI